VIGGGIVGSRELILKRIADARVSPAPAERREVVSGPVNIDHFCDLLVDYRATVHRVSRAGLGGVLKKLTQDQKVLISADFPIDMIPVDLEVAFDSEFSSQELDAFDATITLCRLGVEDTGTIVLDGGIGQGRRAISLVPDHHICLVQPQQVVKSIDAAISLLDPERPLTFISGPSATSDIELVRVEGVHGPRRLDVVLVDLEQNV
jgi:L-lactate dehydrogenase complex protein LldG